MAAEPSWLYLPAEQTLRSHASEVESELRHALRVDEPRRRPRGAAERRESEPSPSAEFVPLSAEFAAQMTLFGAPQRAPSPRPRRAHRTNRRRRALGAAQPEPVASRPSNAAQTCAANAAVWWRNSTAATAAATARSTPGSTARSASSASSRRASEQLERSIEALVRELTRASRRAAASHYTVR